MTSPMKKAASVKPTTGIEWVEARNAIDRVDKAARRAMEGMIAGPQHDSRDVLGIAHEAYEFAEALETERERRLQVPEIGATKDSDGG